MRVLDFNPIDTGELRTIVFDFAKYLCAGETIAGTPVLYCTVLTGLDLLAQARLIGAPQIIASPANGAPASAVSQQIGQMIGGVTYVIQCLAPASPDIPSLWAKQPCDLPSPQSPDSLQPNTTGLKSGMLWNNSGAVCIAGTVPANWHTSPSGLATGTLWSNGGVVCVVGIPPNWPTSRSGLSTGDVWLNGGTAAIV